jgi:hypothetical protein
MQIWDSEEMEYNSLISLVAFRSQIHLTMEIEAIFVVTTQPYRQQFMETMPCKHHKLELHKPLRQIMLWPTCRKNMDSCQTV